MTNKIILCIAVNLICLFIHRFLFQSSEPFLIIISIIIHLYINIFMIKWLNNKKEENKS